MSDESPLDQLARRAAGDPFFLASALAGYQDRHNLDDAALAALLGCDADVLVKLALCRMPGAAPEQHTVEGDIAAIAAHYGIAAGALRHIVGEATGG